MFRRHWRFIVPLLVQGLLLAAVPAQKFYTRAVGKTVLLKVAPVDPYDLMSGYYMVLSYEISQPPQLRENPKNWPLRQQVYVTLVQAPEGHWDAVGLFDRRPKTLPEGQVFIKGRVEGARIFYGIESYFVPEAMRQIVADDLQKNLAEARAEVKIDPDGNPALMRLRIGDRVYEY